MRQNGSAISHCILSRAACQPQHLCHIPPHCYCEMSPQSHFTCVCHWSLHIGFSALQTTNLSSSKYKTYSFPLRCPSSHNNIEVISQCRKPQGPQLCSASMVLHNLFYFSEACSVSHVLLGEGIHCQCVGIASIRLCWLLRLHGNADLVVWRMTVVCFTRVVTDLGWRLTGWLKYL